jgi:hypothetical protein
MSAEVAYLDTSAAVKVLMTESWCELYASLTRIAPEVWVYSGLLLLLRPGRHQA